MENLLKTLKPMAQKLFDVLKVPNIWPVQVPNRQPRNEMKRLTGSSNLPGDGKGMPKWGLLTERRERWIPAEIKRLSQ